MPSSSSYQDHSFHPFSLVSTAKTSMSVPQRVIAEAYLLQPFRWLYEQAVTVILFTARDFITVMFPVSLFACVAAPVPSFSRWLFGIWWMFINLFHINVSNQYKSAEEDSINHAWRPIPSGRISVRNATILRWALLPISLLASIPFGWDLALTNIGLLITIVIYDNFAGAHHWVVKNSLNVWGYALLEYGASRAMELTFGVNGVCFVILTAGHALDCTAMMSILCSAAVICTTIQAQDFADVVGDKVIGRLTMPIHFPELSRVVTATGIVAWSVYLAQLWHLGTISALGFMAFGTWIGARFYFQRTEKADTYSYALYNAWLLFIHILPAQARWQTFSF